MESIVQLTLCSLFGLACEIQYYICVYMTDLHACTHSVKVNKM